MSDKKELESKSDETDPELDELLDSALEDLTKGVEKKESNKDVVASNTNADREKTEQEWADEFIKQTASHFEANMANFLGSMSANEPSNVTQEQLETSLHKIAEAAAQVVNNPQSVPATEQSNDFSATITQTLHNLSLGTENLQNPFTDNDFINMFNPSNNDGNAFLPFMQGMMQSLLSKEVLYPSLKDILDKYPTWLAENKEKISESEYDRYGKQKELMHQVCNELENETDEDGENTKRERFDKVLGLMQKMQDLGQPPPALVGDIGPGLQFDTQGNPILPDNQFAEQCSIM